MIIPSTRGLSAEQLESAEHVAAKLDAMGDAAGQQRMQAYKLLALVAPTHDGRLAFFDKSINAVYGSAQAQSVPAKKAPLLGDAAAMALMAWQDQPTAARSTRADRYLGELEALPGDDAGKVKLAVFAMAAHVFAGDPRELSYANKTIALGRDIQQASASNAVPFEVVTAYYQMATYHALRGEATQVKDIIAHIATSFPDGDKLAEYWMQRLAIYDLIGKPAPEVATNYWLNTSGDDKAIPFKGKLTLLEFAMPTGHSPTPPEIQAISELLHKYDKNKFQIVLATKLVGYSCCGEHLAAEDEIGSIKDFWVQDRKIPAKIAIVDPPWVKESHHPVFGVKAPAPFEHDYRLRTMPAILLVDEAGIVRFVANDFNPAQLSSKIAELMSPKGHGTH